MAKNYRFEMKHYTKCPCSTIDNQDEKPTVEEVEAYMKDWFTAESGELDSEMENYHFVVYEEDPDDWTADVTAVVDVNGYDLYNRLTK